ncbi:MAG: hypothetical protein ABIQ65_20460 [Thermoanaerobaculia bacterium]
MLLEHVRVTWIALRTPALVGVALLAVASLVALPTIARGGPLRINGWPTWMPGTMGALLPIVVWGRDERFGPGFLWTLPVNRHRQALIKVAAGWMWLMVGVVAFLSWLLIMTGITGEHVLPEALHIIGSPAAAIEKVDSAALQTVPWNPGPLMWVVPFAGATTCYLLGSALMLGTKHPLRWVLGVGLLGVLTAMVGEPVGTQFGMTWLVGAPGRLIELVVGSRFGLDAVLTARNLSLSVTATLTTGSPMRVWWSVPDLTDWAVATLLWTTSGALSLWAAVSRHGERRRG